MPLELDWSFVRTTPTEGREIIIKLEEREISAGKKSCCNPHRTSEICWKRGLVGALQ